MIYSGVHLFIRSKEQRVNASSEGHGTPGPPRPNYSCYLLLILLQGTRYSIIRGIYSYIPPYHCFTRVPKIALFLFLLKQMKHASQ